MIHKDRIFDYVILTALINVSMEGKCSDINLPTESNGLKHSGTGIYNICRLILLSFYSQHVKQNNLDEIKGTRISHLW